jgi:hypothetical protein
MADLIVTSFDTQKLAQDWKLVRTYFQNCDILEEVSNEKDHYFSLELFNEKFSSAAIAKMKKQFFRPEQWHLIPDVKIETIQSYYGLLIPENIDSQLTAHFASATFAFEFAQKNSKFLFTIENKGQKEKNFCVKFAGKFEDMKQLEEKFSGIGPTLLEISTAK